MALVTTTSHIESSRMPNPAIITESQIGKASAIGTTRNKRRIPRKIPFKAANRYRLSQPSKNAFLIKNPIILFLYSMLDLWTSRCIMYALGALKSYLKSKRSDQ